MLAAFAYPPVTALTAVAPALLLLTAAPRLTRDLGSLKNRRLPWTESYEVRFGALVREAGLVKAAFTF